MVPTIWAFALAIVLGVTTHAAIVPITLGADTVTTRYRPGRGGQVGTWNQSFTNSDWSAWSAGKAGEGQGYYLGSYADGNESLTVMYEVYGTGIEFFGYWGNLGSGEMAVGGKGTTRLYIEQTGYSGPNNLNFNGTMNPRAMDTAEPVSLGKIEGMAPGYFMAFLQVTSGSVSFTHVVMDADIKATESQLKTARQYPSIRNATKTNEVGESIPDDKFGTWNGKGWTRVGDTTAAGTNVAGDSVHIDLGKGNYWVNVKGRTGVFGAFFEYKFQPTPPMLANASESHQAFSLWEVGSATLVAATLDPNEHYTLTLTSQGSGPYDSGSEQLNQARNWFEVNSLEVWKEGTGPPSKGTPIGAIAGGVVAGVLVLALGIAGIWWWRWGRRRRHTIGPADGFEIDESPVTASTPFVSPLGTALTESAMSESALSSRPSQSSQSPMRQTDSKRPFMRRRHESMTTTTTTDMLSEKRRQSSSNRYSIDSRATDWTRMSSSAGPPLSPSSMVSRGPRPFDDSAPTFQSMDAGPVLATPVEVPPSYNPEWIPPSLQAGPSSSAWAQPSTPGSGGEFFDGTQALSPRVTDSPDPITPPLPDAPAGPSGATDTASADVSPAYSPRQSISSPRESIASPPESTASPHPGPIPPPGAANGASP